jgi:energy-coupling factor transporter ATP-binding protein EcfA2
MKLKSIEFEGIDDGHKIEKSIFNDFTLIVGRNNAGKTRLLNYIWICSYRIPFVFDDRGRFISYLISFHNCMEKFDSGKYKMPPYELRPCLREWCDSVYRMGDQDVVKVIKKALEEYGKEYDDKLKEDLSIFGINFDPFNPLALSSGETKVLEILSLLNYWLLEDTPVCCLIDNFGDGLCFDWASDLTKLVYKKIQSNKIQCIFSTHNRYVMNAIDIDYWNILDSGKVYNIENSPKVWDEWEFTGLNNFDFFSSYYYRGVKEYHPKSIRDEYYEDYLKRKRK